MKKNNFKPMRRVGVVALATTIAISIPTAPNVVSELNPFNHTKSVVVHAQAEETGNLMVSEEVLTNFNVNYNDSYEHWNHTLHNSGDVPVDGPDFDISNLRYVVKLPAELSHLLEDDYVLDYLFGKITNFDSAQTPFTLTGSIVDENGDQITINKDEHKPFEHISINKETNSVEFNFNSFYTDNNIEPYIRQSVDGDWFLNTLGFEMSLNVPDDRMLDNGTYEFKTAIVQGGGVDLDNVSNAYSENLVVDYSTDPEPEPEPEVDTTELEALLEEAKTYEEADYTKESFASLTEAVAGADAVLADEDATQEDVDAALATLEAAVEGLEEVEEEPNPEPEPEPEVDTAELEALVEEAKTYEEADYTEESFASLTEAVAGADAVLADEDATQENVDAALATLEAAVEGLEEVEEEPNPEPEPEPETDTTELEALVEEAKTYEEADYTEESFVSLTEAVAGADAVLADEDATQEDVDAALATLEAAVEGLEEVEEEPNPEPEPEPEVDTAELEALLEEAKAYAEADYTDASFLSLTEAVAGADAVLADEDATQEDVDAALATLEAAVEGLEKVKVVVPEDDVTEGDEEESGDGDKLPETATDTYTLLMMGGLFAAIGGAMLVMRRKFTKV